ncbi:DNA repair protein RecO [Bacillus marinisedimentorum]|uniref:DNA repair protein RecO n=1 Tax=Bacillus marinisedimentorum TaxID=1821260 RepID=UPI000872966D|nr:DNA repair protein RecO [Bacillus marinisedimentorum]
MINKVEGIVIRTNSYGETNKIVTLFTRESGKMGLMARGAKKPKSRLATVSQLFMHGQFLIQSGSGLGTMQQGEIITSFRSIRQDIIATAYASYVAELTDKLTEDKKPNPYLFELLYQTLHYIDEGIDYEVLMFIYEVKMLAVAGLHPTLNECASCGATEGRFGFSIREGGLLCHRCFHQDPHILELSPAAARLLRLFYHFDLNRLGNVSVKEETKNEIRRVLSAYYEEYSGLYLKTKRFLDQIKRLDF